MKDKIIFFAFIMLALALFFSCSKNATEPGDFPDNPLEWYSFEYFMDFYSYDSDSIGIFIMAQDSITPSELTINGQSTTLFLEGWIFTIWMCIPVFDSLYIPLTSGDTVSYCLSIGEKNYNGNIIMAYAPEVIWPDSFDPDKDFSFTWNIEEDPDIYVCTCDVGYENYDDDMNYYWKINSPRNEYTIKKKYFDDSDNLINFEAGLFNYNYRNFGSCFVYSDSYDVKFYQKCSKSYDKDEKISKEKRIERLKALLRVLN